MANTSTDQVPPAEKLASSIPPRERILRAAGEMFHKYGIHAVGVEAIAAAAQSNKMTLYRHFASKEMLIEATIREHHKASEAAWKALHEAHLNDPRGELNGWLEMMYAYIQSPDEPTCKLMDKALDVSDAEHPARVALDEIKHIHLDHLIGMCRAAGFKNHEVLAINLLIVFEGARESRYVGTHRLALLLPQTVQTLMASHEPH
ncbi:TetR/AcrR family transcriptional regulator [Pseudomonas sp. O64]|uniref:TetR/AcrR family transcriptional regulator n=1 Tax=Pseudomonas TaxID=286 RepID=UPI0015960180|nr:MULTISPECIES: TetR/AcrR family transcriptional regulator [unclassified Pseudomonas]MCV2231099.1 TetR/AcrR family transcriptional regulator [Pseudomonas sp. AU10]UNM20318.1 TetR/AcrR family transcriptional regulator [Pseudomonas sp. ArH3a]UXZ23082.1 TetR/AcrR family transcriptional regulator [Pseudomonas sp. YeP6b]